MKKSVFIALAVSFLLIGFIPAQSAKVTAQVSPITIIDWVAGAGAPATGPWQNILVNTLHTSQQKDLFVDVSLEVGLYTKTLVKSKLGDMDSALAQAGVEVRVLIDPGTTKERVAYPGAVVFGRRTQTLSAVFQGLIADCLSVDPETGNVIVDEECVEPEELELILDTMNANAFNFVLDDLGSGDHTVQVQARITVGGALGGTALGSFEAKALVGKGAVSVEEVRMIKGEDFVIQ